MPSTQLPTKPANTAGQGIPIFGLGNQQRSPYISTVDRINCVMEPTDNGRQHAAIYGLPGLKLYSNFGTTPPRAFYIHDGTFTFYAVCGSQIIMAPPNQPQITIGTFSTDHGPCWIDDNGTQLFINDGTTAYVWNYLTNTMTQVTNANYPVGAYGGVFLQGRFWVFVPEGSANTTQIGQVWGSDLYDGTSWTALNFFKPVSKPYGVKALARWFNDLVVFSHGSIEWWSGVSSNVLGGLGFQPVANANSEVGTETTLGIGPGSNQRFFFLGHSEGNPGVYEIQGYSIVKVSPPAIDVLLAGLDNTQAVSTSYMISGHPIWQVTIQGTNSGNSITLIFDGLTNLFSKRISYNQPYYRGLLARQTQHTPYVTDAFNGNVYQMMETVYDDNGDPLIMEVGSVHLLKNGDALAINKLQIDMEVGVGTETGQGSQPRAMVQISKDGGHTWGQEKWIPLGKVGQYLRRAQARRIGRARDIAVKLRISDPIPRRIAGAYLIQETQAA